MSHQQISVHTVGKPGLKGQKLTKIFSAAKWRQLATLGLHLQAMSLIIDNRDRMTDTFCTPKGLDFFSWEFAFFAGLKIILLE